jgi:Tfp pilus assembly protein PilN
VRPVNLMPAGERRGKGAPTRTGPLSYIIVGGLVVVLAAVCGIVVFNKKVSDGEAEVTRIEAHATELQARADALSSFVSFQQIHDARVQTVEQLAQSRFDWERVLRELSKVIPSHIWLVSLTGTVTPDVDVGDGAGDDGGLRASIPGPALVLTGCGRSQDDVASLIAAMKDIDGVNRVTASDSAKPDTAIAADGAGTSDNCQTRPSIPQFHLVASFDEVVVPTADGSVPPAAPETTTDTSASTASTTGAGDGGVPAAEAQNEASKQDVSKADQQTKNATNLIPGG